MFVKLTLGMSSGESPIFHSWRDHKVTQERLDVDPSARIMVQCPSLTRITLPVKHTPAAASYTGAQGCDRADPGPWQLSPLPTWSLDAERRLSLSLPRAKDDSLEVPNV